MLELFYSSTYEEARSRFIESATVAGATLSKHSLGLENGTADEFAIDVATLGPDDAPTLVVSSGLHGVEGFFGSAIQLAMLDKYDTHIAKDIRWVFIHAINPFGFAKVRRFNEDNVDLNRNFLLPGSQYTGAPADYDQLNSLLNPATKPSRYEPFLLKAIWTIVRYGLRALQKSIAEGQYEYPHGIFYGGSKSSRAMEAIQENCEQWMGASPKVLHVDFHSGLGAFGEYKLMLNELAGSERCQWYRNVFGHNLVEAQDDSAYRATGTMGRWLQHRFADRDYRFVTAEFGTYGPLRVVTAIRAENRAHQFAAAQSQCYQVAKRELMECFCPADVSWRRKTVAAGLDILKQAVSGLDEKVSRHSQ